MAVQLSDETEAAYRKVFNLFDKNKDGKISIFEIGQAFLELNKPVTAEYAEALKSKYDTNRSGYIEFPEFVAMIQDLDLKTAFDIFDKDGNGFITVDELDDLFKKLGGTVSAQDLQKMVAEADLNKDGKVSFEEFKKMFGKTGAD